MRYLLILIPFISIIILNLFPKKNRLAAAFWTGAVIFTLQLMMSMIFPFNDWGKVIFRSIEPVLGFNLLFDDLTILLLISSAMVCLTSFITGWSTIKKDDDKFYFTNLLLIALIGINGIAMAGGTVSLYLFIEVTALSSFIMVALYRDKQGLEGSWKYLMLSVVASVLMLTSISLFLMLAPSTTFADIRTIASAGNTTVLFQLAVILFVCGLLIKGGLVPFHGWLPDAYTSAPAPVSVLLAGIVTKASGIFALARFITSASGTPEPLKNVLLLVGILSIVIGALAALGQNDIKRMLAYSSISQMGYIVAGLGIGTALGTFAALFHFFNHAVFKTQLFANAAAIEEQLGTRDMDKMGGLGSKMPVTATTATIASLSTAGIPPLAGFWSKVLIIIALWSSAYYAYAAIALTASIVTLAYFLTLQRKVFFGKVAQGLENIKEAGYGLIIPSVVLTCITVGVGIIFPFFMGVFIK